MARWISGLVSLSAGSAQSMVACVQICRMMNAAVLYTNHRFDDGKLVDAVLHCLTETLSVGTQRRSYHDQFVYLYCTVQREILAGQLEMHFCESRKKCVCDFC